VVLSFSSSLVVSIVTDIPVINLWPVFVIILILSFILIYAVFQLLVLRDVEKVEYLVYNWLEEKEDQVGPVPTFFFSRFRRLDQSIRFVMAEKQSEIDELKKKSHFRREFIANISHELKTPIFSAQGFVHTLIDGAVKDKSVRDKFLKKAAKSLDGLDLLVQDLLTLSQIEIGDIKMHYEYFDIQKLCKEVIEQLEDQIEKKGVIVSLVPKEQVLVFADYRRMGQVMNNLLTNAIKYNKEGGKVKVILEESENYVGVTVSDTGEGIPEEHRGRIFERFYRVEKSRSRRGGGTGLGLAIVKHILEGHNTAINVSSQVGNGTEFSFRLAKEEEINEI
jgi:two-component system phosphate regulon sensor histidine kinase PhoR